MFVHLHRVGNDMVSSSSKKKAESQAVTIKDIEEFAHRTWLITPIALIALIALTRTLSNILRPHYNPNDPRNPHNSGKRRWTSWWAVTHRPRSPTIVWRLISRVASWWPGWLKMTMLLPMKVLCFYLKVDTIRYVNAYRRNDPDAPSW